MEIELTRGQTAIVDESDFDRVSQVSWCYRRDGYAHGRYKRKLVLMHRFIMEAPRESLVDHINGNKLDNRKSNLRLCTFSENAIHRKVKSDNSSGYKGVYFKKEYGRWTSAIQVRGRRKFLGYFDTPEEAYVAYSNAAGSMFGDFRIEPKKEIRQYAAEVGCVLVEE